MHIPEKHVRANLGIAASGKFKDEVFRLAMQKQMTISQFVRETLGEVYPTLRWLDGYAVYAIKRSPRLRQLQEQKAKPRKANHEEEIILF